MQDIMKMVATTKKGQQLQEAAAEAAYLRAAVLWHKLHAYTDGLTTGDARRVKKQRKAERSRQGKAQQEAVLAKRVHRWLDKSRRATEVPSKAHQRGKQKRKGDSRARHQTRQGIEHAKRDKAEERDRVAAAIAKSREDSDMWAPVGVSQKWKMAGGQRCGTGQRCAHKKWDNVRGVRQPAGKRAKYKFKDEQRSTTEAAMWMAAVTMAIASGAGATSWAALAASMAAGAGTGVPVAPLAAVAAGIELKRRQRGKEMARTWHMMDPCEQARAWKKERQKQKEEDGQSQSQMDRKWEQEAESVYASREYATQGMQDKLNLTHKAKRKSRQKNTIYVYRSSLSLSKTPKRGCLMFTRRLSSAS